MDHGDQPRELLGATVSCADGVPLGTACAAYVNRDSGRAEWVALHVGDAAGERMVPLSRACRGERGLVLDVRRDAVERAPLAPATDLGAADEDLLFGYWAQALCPVDGGPVPAVGPDQRLAGALAAVSRLARVAP